MKRAMVWALCALLLASLFSAAALGEEEKVLNIFTWEDYIDYDTLAGFEAKTGIHVNFIPFNSNEEMLLKLKSTQGAYDLVLASDYVINLARKDGLLLPLDKALIPNYANLDPDYLGSYFDPDDLYTVPYTAGTPLIVYDPARVSIEIDGYEDLWDESLRDSVVLIDDARNIVGITLKTMGQSFNTTDADVLAAAGEKLNALAPNVRALDYDTPHFYMISGECAVGYMFTPLVIQALMERPDLQVVYPKEGLGFGIDALFIPQSSPHPQNAHALIDYILDASVGAWIAEYQLYVTPNAAARALLSEELINNPALYIDGELIRNAEFIRDVGEHESDFQKIWTDFKIRRTSL